RWSGSRSVLEHRWVRHRQQRAGRDQLRGATGLARMDRSTRGWKFGAGVGAPARAATDQIKCGGARGTPWSNTQLVICPGPARAARVPFTLSSKGSSRLPQSAVHSRGLMRKVLIVLTAVLGASRTVQIVGGERFSPDDFVTMTFRLTRGGS